MKIKDIKDKYGEYETDENKLRELLTPPKSETIYDLKNDDAYFYICGSGLIEYETYSGDSFDESARSIGNMFLTREEAEFKLERMKIETELIKLGGRIGKNGYSLQYNNLNNVIEPVEFISLYGLITFKTREEAIQAVYEIGEDRLKKYYFGVKDEKETGR